MLSGLSGLVLKSGFSCFSLLNSELGRQMGTNTPSLFIGLDAVLFFFFLVILRVCVCVCDVFIGRLITACIARSEDSVQELVLFFQSRFQESDSGPRLAW